MAAKNIVFKLNYSKMKEAFTRDSSMYLIFSLFRDNCRIGSLQAISSFLYSARSCAYSDVAYVSVVISRIECESRLSLALHDITYTLQLPHLAFLVSKSWNHQAKSRIFDQSTKGKTDVELLGYPLGQLSPTIQEIS